MYDRQCRCMKTSRWIPRLDKVTCTEIIGDYYWLCHSAEPKLRSSCNDICSHQTCLSNFTCFFYQQLKNRSLSWKLSLLKKRWTLDSKSRRGMLQRLSPNPMPTSISSMLNSQKIVLPTRHFDQVSQTQGFEIGGNGYSCLPYLQSSL